MLTTRPRLLQAASSFSTRFAPRLARGTASGAGDTFFADSTFADTGLTQATTEALARSGFTTPSHIQLQAIPSILRGADTVITAETGSGKTIAYLAPILDAVAEESPPATPQALVLAPTRELVAQLRSVACALRPDLTKHIVPAWGAHRINTRLPCALVIATPQAAAQHLRDEPDYFSAVTAVVADEADLLLSGSYRDDVTATLQRFARHHSPPFPLAVLLHSTARHATLPQSGKASPGAWIARHLPAATTCATDLLHRVKPSVRQAFVSLGQLPKDQDAALVFRIQVLLAVLDADAGSTLAHAAEEPAHVAATDLGAVPFERSGAENPLAALQCSPRARRDTQGVLVFVNTARSAQRVAHALTQCGLRTGAIHKKVSGQRREDELRAFREGATQVLVATDVASRGVDLPNASHVVQAEFALDVTSHLHRVGRTARAAAEGKATHIVGPENANLMRALEEQTLFGASDLSSLFSRKRRLRNKLRAQATGGE